MGETRPLYKTSEWNFDTMRRTYDAIAEVAERDLGLDTYPNQIEIISTEQMLDAYSSIGMPLMYQHWSFGKHFARDEVLYRKGFAGLAYEIVINSNPCISYNMEDNTMTMQALVMAHAAFGHNHFFKNNRLFREWTDADGILDYLQFAKGFISNCEERHGVKAVELVLDAAHALMDQGVFRYPRPGKLSLKEEETRQRERIEEAAREYSDLYAHTIPGGGQRFTHTPEYRDEMKVRMEHVKLPEENLLYYIEKQSPWLQPWQREIVRIVRKVAQYFYPQKQTKVMNEGCATFVHYHIMNALYDKKLLTDGAMLEFMGIHSNVLMQPDFDDRQFSGINPYALGYAMMTDIKRICVEPDPEGEDHEWFPDIAGCGDWKGVLKDAWENYRDESFILQYLSPRLIRDMHLFGIKDEEGVPHYEVSAIHDEQGYRKIRQVLAQRYDIGYIEPNIQVTKNDVWTIELTHHAMNKVRLAEKPMDATVEHFQTLWKPDSHVTLTSIDENCDELAMSEIKPLGEGDVQENVR
jgi:spore cortex formation protein SpoVR/YcgB (stage V sporulation)